MQMSYAKERRQQAIADLIRSNMVTSQQDLAALLAERGFAATQATISRDLDQIGAVKVRRSGQIIYSLPVETAIVRGPRYEALLREYARSIEAAANLIVIRTPPGSAHLIGVALDQAEIEGVLGTICGDDTIFAACADNKLATQLAGRLREIAA